MKTLKPRVATHQGQRVKSHEIERQAVGRTWQRIRAQVLSANPACAVCRAAGRWTEAREVDHVVPLWDGGTDALANLQGLCIACHAQKSAGEAARRAGGGERLSGLAR